MARSVPKDEASVGGHSGAQRARGFTDFKTAVRVPSDQVTVATDHVGRTDALFVERECVRVELLVVRFTFESTRVELPHVGHLFMRVVESPCYEDVTEQ